MLVSPDYTFQLQVFEGPLDLLLDLIERAQLDITKVSLAQVTDQYLEHIHSLQDRTLEDLASFLVIATRLIQIKSEALLPRPPIRELGEEDPGDALARQLVAYKRYKQVAILLADREAEGLRTYLRIAAPPPIDPKLELGQLTIEDLRQAMVEVLLNTPNLPHMARAVAPPQVHIRDKIRSLVESLRKIGKVSFQRFVRTARTRLEVVVSFLAVLELIKRDQVLASQDEIFGDIELTPGQAWDRDQSTSDFDLEFEE